MGSSMVVASGRVRKSSLNSPQLIWLWRQRISATLKMVFNDTDMYYTE